MNIALTTAIRLDEPSQRAIPTIGLYYLASYIDKYLPHHRVKVYKSVDDILREKEPIDLAGISSVTENMSVAVEWAERIKESFNIPVILGGDHISALPNTLPKPFDLGVIGEGEETFLDLVKLISSHKGWRNGLSKIAGVCYRDANGKVVVNPARPLIKNMDTIPFPRREKGVWGAFHYMFTSRGCPYRCVFCSPKVIWKIYRPFSANYVMEEMDKIFEKFNPLYIHFFDDLFIGNKKRVRQISDMVVKRGYHRRVYFGGHIRADLIDEDLCRDLARMNFRAGAFGAETGSDEILKFLKTGTTTVEMNQRAVDLCYRFGIDLNLSFIIGTPGETEEDLKKTIDFIEKNEKKMQAIEIFVLMPYPGTPLWKMCLEKGLVSEDMDWDLFRTKAFFSEVEIEDDFLYINQAMDRETFKKYIRIFQEIDRRINRRNFQIFNIIENTVSFG